jgi:hypothetical protein
MIQDKMYNNQTDSYSYGGFLFELLTHVKPWEYDDYENDREKLIDLILKSSPTLPEDKIEIRDPDIISVFKSIANKCWSIDHTLRPNFEEIYIDLIDLYRKLFQVEKDGFNLIMNCNNQCCTSYEHCFIINCGYDHFYLTEYIKNLKCPLCKYDLKLNDITNYLFINCKVLCSVQNGLFQLPSIIFYKQVSLYIHDIKIFGNWDTTNISIEKMDNF